MILIHTKEGSGELVDSVTQTLEEAVQQAAAAFNTIFTVTMLLSLVPYVLFAIGLRSVAGRYGIRNRWMAWIPVCRKYLLAQIADIRRAQAGKDKKLKTQFEIIALLFFACLFVTAKTNNLILIAVLSVLAVLWAYNQVFSYYYFYRLCDRENATAYFLLGLLAGPLNSVFVFHCR